MGRTQERLALKQEGLALKQILRPLKTHQSSADKLKFWEAYPQGVCGQIWQGHLPAQVLDEQSNSASVFMMTAQMMLLDIEQILKAADT